MDPGIGPCRRGRWGHLDGSPVLRALQPRDPLVPGECGPRRTTPPCERVRGGAEALPCGRRRPEPHPGAVLSLRLRRPPPHPRRSARGGTPAVRGSRRWGVGAARGHRPGLLGRRGIPAPGGHRKPGRLRGASRRRGQAGPAHDPSHLVRRLGSPGVVRPALAPRPHLSRTGGPAAPPPCRGGRAGRVRERSPGAAPGPRRPVQSRHRRRRYWSEPVRGHQPGALPAAGRGLRGRADPDPALRADPATGAGCPVDHRLLAVQARSDSARRRPQPQRTGRGLRRLRARRRVHGLFSAWHHGGSRPARRMELRWTGAQCDAEALAEHPGERPLSRRAPGLQRYAGHRGCRGDDWGRPTGNPHFGRGGEPADLRPLVPEPGGDSSYSASTKRISTTTRGRTASSTWTWSGACRLLPGSGGGVQGIGKAETHVFLDAVHRRDFQIGVLPQLVDQLVHQLFGR